MVREHHDRLLAVVERAGQPDHLEASPIVLGGGHRDPEAGGDEVELLLDRERRARENNGAGRRNDQVGEKGPHIDRHALEGPVGPGLAG